MPPPQPPLLRRPCHSCISSRKASICCEWKNDQPYAYSGLAHLALLLCTNIIWHPNYCTSDIVTNLSTQLYSHEGFPLSSLSCLMESSLRAIISCLKASFYFIFLSLCLLASCEEHLEFIQSLHGCTIPRVTPTPSIPHPLTGKQYSLTVSHTKRGYTFLVHNSSLKWRSSCTLLLASIHCSWRVVTSAWEL